jgi:hypothetical protein
MPTPPIPDDELREVIEVWRAHDCRGDKAAASIGMNPKTFDYRLARARAKGFHLSDGARHIVKAAKLAPVEARGGWVHSYDDDGKKIGATRWAPPEDGAEAEAWLDKVAAAFASVPAVPPVPAPDMADADLLTIYPLADAHVGMLAYGKETGESYNTDIAADRIRSWVARAVAASPSSAVAVILDVGDLTHADDDTNVTPRSKHPLTVDSRHFRTLDVTIAALSTAIECALQKHGKVIVRILPGNHNQTSYMAVMFALAERYRNEPRVEVQKVPGEFFVMEFGAVMLAAHHGHGAKPERMVHFLADEYAQMWGRTRHRFLWTGHLHHLKAQDIGGVQHEQLRAITARDAYAVSQSYSARAQLQAITLHRDRGEVQRVKVGA